MNQVGRIVSWTASIVLIGAAMASRVRAGNMRIRHHLIVLALGLAAAAPGLAQAAPIPTITIDESVEGATPTFTISSGLFATVAIDPVAGVTGEEWTVAITVSGGLGGTFGQGGNLLEPNSTAVSDALVFQSLTSAGGNDGTGNYLLFSDDELGHIGGSCTAVGCLNATEDGTFQLVDVITSPDVGTVNVLLKSDVDPVPAPEPSSGALLASMLGAFLLIGFWRKPTYRR